MRLKVLLEQIHISQRVRVYDKTKTTLDGPILIFDSDFPKECLDEADRDALTELRKYVAKARVTSIYAVGKGEIKILVKPKRLNPVDEMGMLWLINYLGMSKEEKRELKRIGKESR